MNATISIISVCLFLNSCAGFQGVADDVEKVLNNDAITVKVDKDAFDKNTNVRVQVDVQNTDQYFENDVVKDDVVSEK